MEDVGSIEDDLEELSSLRRHRIDLLNKKKYPSIGRNPVNPISSPMGQETDYAPSDAAARISDTRKVIENAHNERLEDNLRRLSDKMFDLNEIEISDVENRVRSAEERHQKLEMESRLAIEERRIRDRLDLERRKRLDTLSSEVKKRVSAEIDEEFRHRLHSLEMRVKLEHDSEIERLDRRLELELSDAYSKTSNMKLEARKAELQTEMRERLSLYRRKKEIEINDRIEKERLRATLEIEKKIKQEMNEIETRAMSEIDQDLSAWYSAEKESMSRIAEMRKRETLLARWAEVERKIQASRSSQILDIKNRLNRLKNDENHDLDVDELVSIALSKWDKIVDETISRFDQ